MFLKRIIASLLVVTFTSTTVLPIAYADVPPVKETVTSSGTFTILSKGTAAPFAGSLFDPKATAVLLTDKDNQTAKCKLQMDVLNETAKNECKYQSGILQIKLDAEKELHNKDNEIKDKEISKLEKVAEGKADYSLLYAGGGFAGGVVLTLLVLWASSKITK